MPILREHVREILLADEEALEAAVLLLLEVEKTVVEGAGAAALAAVLAHRPIFAKRRVGVVLSGGNIDMLVLAHVIERGLARTARLARVVVRVRDVPGALAEVTSAIANAGANVVEVLHERAFARAPSSRGRGRVRARDARRRSPARRGHGRARVGSRRARRAARLIRRAAAVAPRVQRGLDLGVLRAREREAPEHDRGGDEEDRRNRPVEQPHGQDHLRRLRLFGT